MIGVAVAAPWILMVVGRYGLAPLTSAGGTGLNPVESVFRLVTFRVTDEPLLGLVGGLAALGAVYALAVRRFLLPVWVAAVVLLDPRGSVTFASVPLAMLAASGLLDVVAARVSGVGGDITRTTGWPAAFLRSTAVRAVIVGSLVLAMLSALLAPYLLGSMATLSPDTRAAMTWVRDAVPAGSRVVVVTGRDWYEDATAEWFPYLAQRASVATVQGYEWLGCGCLDEAAGHRELAPGDRGLAGGLAGLVGGLARRRIRRAVRAQGQARRRHVAIGLLQRAARFAAFLGRVRGHLRRPRRDDRASTGGVMARAGRLWTAFVVVALTVVMAGVVLAVRRLRLVRLQARRMLYVGWRSSRS